MKTDHIHLPAVNVVLPALDVHLLSDDRNTADGYKIKPTPATAPLMTRDQIAEAVRLLKDYAGQRQDLRTARCHVGITEQAHCRRCARDLAAWQLLEDIGIM